MNLLKEISEALQKGRAAKVKELVTQALGEGVAAEIILQELLSAMDVIGEKFKNNVIFVPEVLVAARAMNAGAELLQSYLADDEAANKGTVVIGTVKGDLHDIGKNLVRMMMEGKGLKVIDLGVNVPSEAFLEAVKTHNAQIIACSALLTTTMYEMKTIIDAVRAAGLGTKVIIGGAPVSQSFCDEIGADGYAADAASAADLAVHLIRQFNCLISD